MLDDDMDGFVEMMNLGSDEGLGDSPDSSSLVMSTRVGNNCDSFADILELYVPKGSLVADVTYGKGAFWSTVQEDDYNLLATDLKTGTDFRNLPYSDSYLDVFVLDPPYMHTPGGSTYKEGALSSFEDHYRNNASPSTGPFKYHDAVLRLYLEGIQEAYRCLRNKGLLIVKCQDEICAGQMRMTSMEIIHYLVNNKWTVEDMFVVVAFRRPGVSRMKKQQHSRRNHSVFLVARKTPPPKMAMRLATDVWP